MYSRRRKVSILAFEVANTIAIGANLLQSLSSENIHFLKNDILHSQGVQQLVSTDMQELLAIAAADIREEFNVFTREVVRFGNLSKDVQWHNLDRIFERLQWDPINYKESLEEAHMAMQELTNLAQHTSELYHQLNAVSILEDDYRKKLGEVDEPLHLPQRVVRESLVIIKSELKNKRRLIRSLKKKSLWEKGLGEVLNSLFGIVLFMQQAILKAYEDNGLSLIGEEHSNKPERLGVAGLALHYANIITIINNIASRPTSLSTNIKDMLYHWLPTSVKTSLRAKLQSFNGWEELTIPQIKDEMEKTLTWLVPIATNTIKLHRSFRWVGEWANSGNEFGKKAIMNNSLIRIQTLYHADKLKMDLCILELVTWLHHLIEHAFFPNAWKPKLPSPRNNNKTHGAEHSSKGSNFLEEVNNLLEELRKGRRLAPGISKSQDFMMGNKRGAKVLGPSRSSPRMGV